MVIGMMMEIMAASDISFFFCCQELLEFCSEEDFTPEEISQEYDFRICPFCGFKLSMLR